MLLWSELGTTRRARDGGGGDRDHVRADPADAAGHPGGRRLARGVRRPGGVAMSAVWITIVAMTVISFVIKAAGPVALGGRDLPLWADRLIVLIPAALLSSLVVVQTFADGQELVLDARAPAARRRSAIALWRATASPLVVVLLVAAAHRGRRPARDLGWDRSSQRRYVAAPPRTRSTRARGGCPPRGRGRRRCRRRACGSPRSGRAARGARAAARRPSPAGRRRRTASAAPGRAARRARRSARRATRRAPAGRRR